jgi:hypothetical protein
LNIGVQVISVVKKSVIVTVSANTKEDPTMELQGKVKSS